MSTPLNVSEEVLAALAEGKPIVALESTIISHGFPYPANVECALMAEQAVRDGGAVPATIAILGGRMKVGWLENPVLLSPRQGLSLRLVS